MKAVHNRLLSQVRRYLGNHSVVDSQSLLELLNLQLWNQHQLKNYNLRLKKKLNNRLLSLLFLKMPALILGMDLTQAKQSILFNNLRVTGLIFSEDSNSQKLNKQTQDLWTLVYHLKVNKRSPNQLSASQLAPLNFNGRLPNPLNLNHLNL